MNDVINTLTSIRTNNSKLSNEKIDSAVLLRALSYGGSDMLLYTLAKYGLNLPKTTSSFSHIIVPSKLYWLLVFTNSASPLAIFSNAKYSFWFSFSAILKVKLSYSLM